MKIAYTGITRVLQCSNRVTQHSLDRRLTSIRVPHHDILATSIRVSVFLLHWSSPVALLQALLSSPRASKGADMRHTHWVSYVAWLLCGWCSGVVMLALTPPHSSGTRVTCGVAFWVHLPKAIVTSGKTNTRSFSCREDGFQQAKSPFGHLSHEQATGNFTLQL